jgi:hypothetical protein
VLVPNAGTMNPYIPSLLPFLLRAMRSSFSTISGTYEHAAHVQTDGEEELCIASCVFSFLPATYSGSERAIQKRALRSRAWHLGALPGLIRSFEVSEGTS